MPKVFINGIHIHYQQTGEGADVVLIHGVASNLALWHRDFVPSLAKQFRVMTYDLRGHGYSDTPPDHYTSADMAADLKGLLEHLGISQACLIGHSFGGLVALHYALLNPASVTKLVLVDTGVPAVEPERKGIPVFEAWRRGLQRLGTFIPEEKQDDMNYLITETRKLRLSSGIPQKALPKIEKLMYQLEETSLIEDCRGEAGLTLDKIVKVNVPVLLCYGERSPAMATCRYLESHLPSCHSVIIQDAGHLHLLTHPQRLLIHLKRFLLQVRQECQEVNTSSLNPQLQSQMV